MRVRPSAGERTDRGRRGLRRAGPGKRVRSDCILRVAGDPKSEITLRDVGVHGEHAPLDAVGAGSNGLEGNLEHVRVALVRPGRAVVDTLAALVDDLERAESGFEPLREPDAH